jgi:hypothetical protein
MCNQPGSPWHFLGGRFKADLQPSPLQIFPKDLPKSIVNIKLDTNTTSFQEVLLCFQFVSA